MLMLLVLSQFLVLGLWAPASAASPAPETVRTWNFDGDPPEQLAPRFVRGTFFVMVIQQATGR